MIILSRNFGHQTAVTPVSTMWRTGGRARRRDLRGPPEVVTDMIRKSWEGSDAVYRQRRIRERESAFRLWTAKGFYRLMGVLTSRSLPCDAGDFRLIDRRVVQAFRQMREKHRFIRRMVSWIGFKQAPVLYDRRPRRVGTTKHALTKPCLFALDAITSFPTVPLRLISVVGVAIIVATILLSLVIVGIRISLPFYFIPGFATLTLLTILFGGLHLVSLGLVGDYSGRMSEQVKNPPIYLIRDIAHSDMRSSAVSDLTGHQSVQRRWRST